MIPVTRMHLRKTLLVVGVIIGCLTIPRVTLILIKTVHKSHVALAKKTIKRLADEIETAQRRTGRLPGSNADLPSYLGHSLPQSPWYACVDYGLNKSNEFFLRIVSPYP